MRNADLLAEGSELTYAFTAPTQQLPQRSQASPRSGPWVSFQTYSPRRGSGLAKLSVTGLAELPRSAKKTRFQRDVMKKR